MIFLIISYLSKSGNNINFVLFFDIMKHAFNRKYCEKSNHQNGELILICLNDMCKQDRFCCLKCVDQNHQRHDLISFNKLSEELNNKIHRNSRLGQKNKIYGILQQCHTSLSSKINELKVQLLKCIYECQDNIERFFCGVYQSFSFQSADEILKNIFQSYDTNLASQYILQLNKSEEHVFTNASDCQKHCNSAVTILSKSIEETKTSVLAAFKNLTKNLIKLKVTSSDHSQIDRFSKINKSAFLKLSDSQNMVWRGQGGGNSPIALLERPIDAVRNKVKFCISEQNIDNKSIMIGVCVFQVVSGFNFQNCQGNNRGCYAIYKNGDEGQVYSLSDHDKNYFNKPINFGLEVGEEISVQVDYNKSIVVFKKGQQQFEQPISLNKGSIYGFAGPCWSGDKVMVK